MKADWDVQIVFQSSHGDLPFINSSPTAKPFAASPPQKKRFAS